MRMLFKRELLGHVFGTAFMFAWCFRVLIVVSILWFLSDNIILDVYQNVIFSLGAFAYILQPIIWAGVKEFNIKK